MGEEEKVHSKVRARLKWDTSTEVKNEKLKPQAYRNVFKKLLNVGYFVFNIKEIPTGGLLYNKETKKKHHRRWG